MKPDIITSPIPPKKAVEYAEKTFGDMAKIAVDVEREIIAIGCEIHYQCRDALVSDGSNEAHVWGANVYPMLAGEKRISFVSTSVNPREGNASVEIESPDIRRKVMGIVAKYLTIE